MTMQNRHRILLAMSALIFPLFVVVCLLGLVLSIFGLSDFNLNEAEENRE